MAHSTKDNASVSFIPNPVISGREAHYVTLNVSVPKIIESWRASLFSFEWMLPDGRIKGRDELSETEKPKRDAAEAQIKAGGGVEMPVLGIGLLDNVEIGTGRALLLTLAAMGVPEIPVHVPASHQDEFDAFQP